jgi:hypothetical protein
MNALIPLSILIRSLKVSVGNLRADVPRAELAEKQTVFTLSFTITGAMDPTSDCMHFPGCPVRPTRPLIALPPRIIISPTTQRHRLADAARQAVIAQRLHPARTLSPLVRPHRR